MLRSALLFAPSLPLSSSPPRILLSPRLPRVPPRTTRYTTAVLSPPQQTAAVALAVPALPIVAYSEYILFTTGCGLPPGPSGIIGAAEGVSYLVVGALVLASLYSKVTTGKGLPDGPGKLLGAAEGIAFLLAVGGIAIAGYTSYKYGDLPTAVPTEGGRCFPKE